MNASGRAQASGTPPAPGDAAAFAPRHWRLLALCSLLSMLDGFDLQMLALAVPLVARDWAIPAGGFGIALSAAIAGLGLGSLIFGPLGDRIGRRGLIVWAAPVIGLSSLGVITATSVGQLVAWRLATGIGFGMVLPNALALVAEVVPAQRRVLGMTLLTTAMSLGAMAAGFVGPVLVGLGGWRALFQAGGALPLLLWPLLARYLEESPRHLARHRPQPAGPAGPRQATSDGGQGLITALYALLWMLTVFTFYFLVSWMPTLLVRAGRSQAEAMHSVAFVNGGGLIAALILSWVIDRAGHRFGAVLALVYLLAAALFLALERTIAVAGLTLTVLLIGGAIGGSSFLMPGVASRLYPAGRLGTVLGVVTTLSRIGAVLGPFFGGQLIAMALGLGTIFAIFAAVAGLCLIAALALQVAAGRGAQA